MRKDIIIKNSSGGMTNDLFDRDPSRAHILKNYDIFTDPDKLRPHLSPEVGDSSAATNKIGAFEFDGTAIYGLGDNGSGVFKLFVRTNFTGSTWTADQSPFVPYDDTMLHTFKFYKTTGKLYGLGAGDLTKGNNRYAWSVTPGSTFAQKAADLGTFTYASNTLHHSKDDRLYFGHDNKISINSNDSWTVAALTLPANYIITQLSEYGNYLAIACRPIGGGNSRTFLWDRDVSLATVTESVDWGPGNLMVQDELEGVIIGVSFEGDVVGAAVIAQTRVTVRIYGGSTTGAEKVPGLEFTGYSQSPAIESTLFRQKYRNRILFPARIPIGTTLYDGVWSIGRAGPNKPFTMVLEYLYSDTGTPSTRYGILQVGDVVFSSYAQRVSGSDVMHMDKTDDAAVYTQTSARESLINPGMPEEDRDRRKQLVFGGLSYEPLPSGAQAVLKYRVDGGSWQTIFTDATTGRVVTEKIISGLIGRNFEFRDESTGGAIITGLRYKYDTLQSLI